MKKGWKYIASYIILMITNRFALPYIFWKSAEYFNYNENILVFVEQLVLIASAWFLLMPQKEVKNLLVNKIEKNILYKGFLIFCFW